jgi:hypothetical protein
MLQIAIQSPSQGQQKAEKTLKTVEDAENFLKSNVSQFISVTSLLLPAASSFFS